MVVFEWPPEFYNSDGNALDHKLSKYKDKGMKKTNFLDNDRTCLLQDVACYGVGKGRIGSRLVNCIWAGNHL